MISLKTQLHSNNCELPISLSNCGLRECMALTDRATPAKRPKVGMEGLLDASAAAPCTSSREEDKNSKEEEGEILEEKNFEM